MVTQNSVFEIHPRCIIVHFFLMLNISPLYGCHGVLGALYQRPPPPLPGQASAESSLPPPRSPSLHPVPPVLMSRDLPSALGLGLPSANSGLFVVGCADSLSECVDAVFTQGPYQGW